MKQKILALICCAFALCLALVGCGGGDGGGDAEAAKAAFAGTWNLSGMTQNGQETPAEQLAALSSLGLEVNLNLNDDGTSELVLFGEPLKGTWEASSTTAGKITLDGENIDMTIDNGALNMQQGEASLTFSKGEASAAGSSGSAPAADAASSEGAEEASSSSAAQ